MVLLILIAIILLLSIGLFLSHILLMGCKAEQIYTEKYVIMGKKYYEKGLYDQAITAFTQAIDVNPQLAIAYLGRAYAYARKGQPEVSLSFADFDQFIKLNQLNEWNYTGRGIAYAMQEYISIDVIRKAA